MYYKEYLRVRNAVVVYTLVLLVLLVAIVVIAIASPADVTVDTNGPVATHATQHSTTVEKSTAHTVVKQDVPWPALFGGAAFLAAILATAFGGLLAQDNDGHLDLVWTKPQSRRAYATTAMAVDAAGILAAQVIGFALIVAPLAIVAHNVRFVAGPDPVMNSLRFALFPLAWYALVVALSARLRGGGLVQGAIWPAALILTGLTFAPLGAIWHGILIAINLINPLTYVHYEDSGMQIVTGQAWLSPTGAALALVALIIGGWAIATAQWRRLEA